MLPLPPVPLLLLLALLVPSSLAHDAAVDPLRRGFDLPLFRHSQLSRRTSPDALRSWALRESSKVNGRYGATGGDNRREREKRATTALSVAGYGTASGSSTASASASAKSAVATSPVGMVDVMNYEADL